jgi:hypothetical protein
MVGLTPIITSTNESNWYFAADGSTLVWGSVKQAQIYDISNQLAPKRKGLVAGEPIMVAGDFVYLAVEGEIHIWNPSQPNGLTPLAPGLSTGWPFPIFVSADQLVYLLGRKSPDQLVMQVIDLREPTNSQEVAAVDWNLSVPYVIKVISGFVYTLYDGYLGIVDVTSAPVASEVKTISLPANINSQIEVIEDRAYVLASSTLYIFDVSDPANPEQIGQYQDWNINYLNVVNSQIYLTWQVCEGHENSDGTVRASCGQGIELVDFTDPAEPLYLGVLRLGMPAEWIEATYFTVEAAYFVTSTVIYALDLEGQVLP